MDDCSGFVLMLKSSSTLSSIFLGTFLQKMFYLDNLFIDDLSILLDSFSSLTFNS